MKSDKLKALLASIENLHGNDSSTVEFAPISEGKAIQLRGGNTQCGGTNGFCSGNVGCAGNEVCINNSGCAGNNGCRENGGCHADEICA